MRPAILAAGLAATTALTVLPALPAQAVRTDQSSWVPVSGDLVVRGHGFGHGHGMSQYGAQGAALQGLSFRRILRFYYPGTRLGEATDAIRVLLTGDTTADVQVLPRRGLRLTDTGTGDSWRLPRIDGVRRWRINPDGARDTIGYLTGRWHRWEPGGRAALSGPGEFSAPKPVTLVTPYGERAYRGALRAAPAGGGDRDTVNVLSLDDYVRGVVPAEMPASWQPEAVRAQAVAARTYAAWNRSVASGRSYDLCDTTSCQVYAGVAGEDPRADDAVRATASLVLRYGGKPAFTQFSSSSGGWTSDGGQPYLVAKRDRFDDFAGNPVHEWTVSTTADRLERAYPRIGTLRRVRFTERDGHGQWGGRVERLVLDGTRDDVTLSGDDLRWLLGLRSSWFTVDPTPITLRWRALGGRRSPLGEATRAEKAVRGGSAQRFEHGRIWWSERFGAREVYGPVLRAYRRAGAEESRLGFPRTGVQQRGPGQRVRFEDGLVFWHPADGTTKVMGPIADRYRRLGGIHSDLGWPVHGNRPTATGERVDFRHGWVELVAATGRTRVHLDPA